MTTISERLRRLADDDAEGAASRDILQAADTIDALVAAGQKLSNCAYNLAQESEVTTNDQEVLRAACVEWDAALALARKGGG